MSRGSTFTLYRAYKNFAVDEDSLNKIREEYYKYNKKHDYFGEKDFFTGKPHSQKEIDENERRLHEDVPEIMEMDFSSDNQYFDRENYASVEELRKCKYTNYVMRDSGKILDKLLEWDFPSGFNCLISEYGLNYGFRNNAVIIDTATAREMLMAIEYLLGGKYDDNLEMAMNNRFIRIFSDGNNCDSYWRYVNRHRFDKKKTEYEFSDVSGVNVKVILPFSQKTDNDGEEDSEDMFDIEISESNSEQEVYLRRTANALRAFLESDEWSIHDDSELVLVYSCWG